MATVTAIIPTTGRFELRRAVESVLLQTHPVRPLIVLDRPDNRDQVIENLRGLEYKLVETAGSIGGGAARNLGIDLANSDFVAFLDDDDEWAKEKTRLQLAIAPAGAAAVTCRTTLTGRGRSRVVPEIVYDNSNDILNYLLDRSTLRLSRHFIQTSSLLVPTPLAKRIQWKASLPRHQDWTWIKDLRASGAKLVTHPAPLVVVYQDSVGSISRSNNYEASAKWLLEEGVQVHGRPRGDFLCSVAARGAFAAGDWQAGIAFLRRAVKSRPHLAAVAVAASGIAEYVNHRSQLDRA